MKRFTATEKWDKAWFQDLPLAAKCLWHYLCDNCDASGVWESNWRLASFQIGETFTVDSLKAFGDRVEILLCGKVWIVGFCEFQYGQLSRECRAQNHVFRQLEKHGLLDRVKNLLNNLSNRVSNTLQETDKDKEEETDKESEAEKEREKSEKANQLRALANRICGIMRRKSETAWSEKEKTALRKIFPVPDDDLSTVEWHYTNPPPGEDYRRRDVLTLLNNWPGEVDRARRRKNGSNGTAPIKSKRPY